MSTQIVNAQTVRPKSVALTILVDWSNQDTKSPFHPGWLCVHFGPPPSSQQQQHHAQMGCSWQLTLNVYSGEGAPIVKKQNEEPIPKERRALLWFANEPFGKYRYAVVQQHCLFQPTLSPRVVALYADKAELDANALVWVKGGTSQKRHREDSHLRVVKRHIYHLHITFPDGSLANQFVAQGWGFTVSLRTHTRKRGHITESPSRAVTQIRVRWLDVVEHDPDADELEAARQTNNDGGGPQQPVGEVPLTEVPPTIAAAGLAHAAAHAAALAAAAAEAAATAPPAHAAALAAAAAKAAAAATEAAAKAAGASSSTDAAAKAAAAARAANAGGGGAGSALASSAPSVPSLGNNTGNEMPNDEELKMYEPAVDLGAMVESFFDDPDPNQSPMSAVDRGLFSLLRALEQKASIVAKDVDSNLRGVAERLNQVLSASSQLAGWRHVEECLRDEDSYVKKLRVLDHIADHIAKGLPLSDADVQLPPHIKGKIDEFDDQSQNIIRNAMTRARWVLEIEKKEAEAGKQSDDKTLERVLGVLLKDSKWMNDAAVFLKSAEQQISALINMNPAAFTRFREISAQGVKWPHSPHLRRSVERAGFVFRPMMIKRDRSICDACGVEVSGWRPWHNPWLFHDWTKRHPFAPPPGLRSGNTTVMTGGITPGSTPDNAPIPRSVRETRIATSVNTLRQESAPAAAAVQKKVRESRNDYDEEVRESRNDYDELVTKAITASVEVKNIKNQVEANRWVEFLRELMTARLETLRPTLIAACNQAGEGNKFSIFVGRFRFKVLEESIRYPESNYIIPVTQFSELIGRFEAQLSKKRVESSKQKIEEDAKRLLEVELSTTLGAIPSIRSAFENYLKLKAVKEREESFKVNFSLNPRMIDLFKICGEIYKDIVKINEQNTLLIPKLREAIKATKNELKLSASLARTPRQQTRDDQKKQRCDAILAELDPGGISSMMESAFKHSRGASEDHLAKIATLVEAYTAESKESKLDIANMHYQTAQTLFKNGIAKVRRAFDVVYNQQMAALKKAVAENDVKTVQALEAAIPAAQDVCLKSSEGQLRIEKESLERLHTWFDTQWEEYRSKSTARLTRAEELEFQKKQEEFDKQTAEAEAHVKKLEEAQRADMALAKEYEDRERKDNWKKQGKLRRERLAAMALKRKAEQEKSKKESEVGSLFNYVPHFRARKNMLDRFNLPEKIELANWIKEITKTLTEDMHYTSGGGELTVGDLWVERFALLQILALTMEARIHIKQNYLFPTLSAKQFRDTLYHAEQDLFPPIAETRLKEAEEINEMLKAIALNLIHFIRSESRQSESQQKTAEESGAAFRKTLAASNERSEKLFNEIMNYRIPAETIKGLEEQFKFYSEKLNHLSTLSPYYTPGSRVLATAYQYIIARLNSAFKELKKAYRREGRPMSEEIKKMSSQLISIINEGWRYRHNISDTITAAGAGGGGTRPANG